MVLMDKANFLLEISQIKLLANRIKLLLASRVFLNASSVTKTGEDDKNMPPAGSGDIFHLQGHELRVEEGRGHPILLRFGFFNYLR